jgi:hypothetical protein
LDSIELIKGCVVRYDFKKAEFSRIVSAMSVRDLIKQSSCDACGVVMYPEYHKGVHGYEYRIQDRIGKQEVDRLANGHMAGSAAALMGVIPFLLGALVSPLVCIVGEGTAVPLDVIILSTSAAAMLSYFLISEKRGERGGFI